MRMYGPSSDRPQNGEGRARCLARPWLPVANGTGAWAMPRSARGLDPEASHPRQARRSALLTCVQENDQWIVVRVQLSAPARVRLADESNSVGDVPAG